ncbi:hypothetical protein LTSEURB_3162, partial [Salmonella enterica subsp. enterica serovar Urbana str. R8-2977]
MAVRNRDCVIDQCLTGIVNPERINSDIAIRQACWMADKKPEALASGFTIAD